MKKKENDRDTPTLKKKHVHNERDAVIHSATWQRRNILICAESIHNKSETSVKILPFDPRTKQRDRRGMGEGNRNREKGKSEEKRGGGGRHRGTVASLFLWRIVPYATTLHEKKKQKGKFDRRKEGKRNTAAIKVSINRKIISKPP